MFFPVFLRCWPIIPEIGCYWMMKLTRACLSWLNFTRNIFSDMWVLLAVRELKNAPPFCIIFRRGSFVGGLRREPIERIGVWIFIILFLRAQTTAIRLRRSDLNSSLDIPDTFPQINTTVLNSNALQVSFMFRIFRMWGSILLLNQHFLLSDFWHKLL